MDTVDRTESEFGQEPTAGGAEFPGGLDAAQALPRPRGCSSRSATRSPALAGVSCDRRSG